LKLSELQARCLADFLKQQTVLVLKLDELSGARSEPSLTGLSLAAKRGPFDASLKKAFGDPRLKRFDGLLAVSQSRPILVTDSLVFYRRQRLPVVACLFKLAFRVHIQGRLCRLKHQFSFRLSHRRSGLCEHCGPRIPENGEVIDNFFNPVPILSHVALGQAAVKIAIEVAQG
jgi:hypothetical protein